MYSLNYHCIFNNYVTVDRKLMHVNENNFVKKLSSGTNETVPTIE